ncbi:hypothetical protein ABT390_33825 [Streptomyces aurantiacus]|nr:hypothetical protein [Streptomyces aurantiacus]
MSHTVKITTPARHAMAGHDLTDARTILASDADLYPARQRQSTTCRAVAYSVYCPATDRYSLVTLDGRWIIPGKEGYKTRGPVLTYVRKNVATVVAGAPEAPAVGAPAVKIPVTPPTQTPETAPAGTPENARRLISASETGRAYVTGNGDRMRIESTDGRMAYTLRTVPEEGHQEAKNGFAACVREFAGEVARYGAGAPKWRKRPLSMWPGKPPRAKEFTPVDYAPGVMLAWTVDGARYTGQVWANRIRSGEWNGNRGQTSAVVVATVDGRRARRDEAVCLPFVHGSTRKRAYAFVATPRGNADVEVIAPECASDGLFDRVATTGDPIEEWEAEGGYVPGVEPAPEAAPADTAAPEGPAGAHCHRCGTDTVFGAECRTCGRVDIVTALMPSGPMLCPAEEKAMATGHQYCPRCFTVGVALYATTLHTGPAYVCAECYTAAGRRLPEAGPAPVQAPARDVIRAARAARKKAEESGASLGEIHRAGEAARKAAAVAYGQRPADVISDPCSVDVWEDEGGACIGVDRPSAPGTGWRARPVGTDPSPEMDTCTAPAVDVTPVRPDAVSDSGAIDTWDGEDGAVTGVGDRAAGERGTDDPYAVHPAAPEWAPVPGTNRRTTELTCAGRQYRVYHTPDTVVPYTLGDTDTDLGRWVGLDDVRAIIRADRRRTAALEADRRRIESQQRRAAWKLAAERPQTPLRPTEDRRRAVARRAEEKHRPVAAELYVSPLTGAAVLSFVCGTCRTAAHGDSLRRPQGIEGSYRSPLAVGQEKIAVLVEKRGWTLTGTWTAHGTNGTTLRAPIAPTPAYLAWMEAMYGPGPQTPEVNPGEFIAPVQRGWWDVVSAEGNCYELTWRPHLTGARWSVRHKNKSGDGFETVATERQASTVLAALRTHSAKSAGQPRAEYHESVHVPIAS